MWLCRPPRVPRMPHPTPARPTALRLQSAPINGSFFLINPNTLRSAPGSPPRIPTCRSTQAVVSRAQLVTAFEGSGLFVLESCEPGRFDFDDKYFKTAPLAWVALFRRIAPDGS